MGSGKTNLGRKLAKELNLEFFDQDEEIERLQDRSIARIFREDGESRFRSLERDVLLDLLEKDNFLLACGGGAPCYRDNMTLMNEAGKTVYLKVSHHVLFKRLSARRETRPLIAHLDDPGLDQYISEKLREREPFYLKAKLWIDPTESTIDTLIRSILF